MDTKNLIEVLQDFAMYGVMSKERRAALIVAINFLIGCLTVQDN